MKNSTTFAYADDTAIIVTHESLEAATQIIQKEFNIMTRWCHDNGLVINATKTKIMHFRPRHIARTNITPIFHNTECLHRTCTTNNITNDSCSERIELVETYKYLGVHLDEHFKWKVHIDILHKKLRQTSYALYHLGNCSPYKVLRQAYFSLAESYLRHGITAWGTATYCRELQTAQDRILKRLSQNQHKFQTQHQNSRNIHNCNATDQQQANNNNFKLTKNTQLHKHLQILNIKNIYKTTIINEFYNDINILKPINHNKNTRNAAQGRFQIPRFCNNYGKHSLDVILPTTFNNLPKDLTSITNKLSRKKLIKNHFLNNL